MSEEEVNDVDFRDCLGKIFKSSHGDFIVTSYNNSNDVTIKFIKTGYITKSTLGNLRKGKVKDLYYPSVHGQGVLGSKYPFTYKNDFGNKCEVREYRIWKSFITRCYSEKRQDCNPTYKGCFSSENFKHYEYFYEWCNRQIGFTNDNWELDKDLLDKGNKVYSEDTCVFLPKEVNMLLVNCRKSRGEYPVGVSHVKQNNKFRSRLSYKNGTEKFLGYFKTPEEAFLAYKQAKEDYAKELAFKWKDQIDHRAYEALMNYQVDIDD